MGSGLQATLFSYLWRWSSDSALSKIQAFLCLLLYSATDSGFFWYKRTWRCNACVCSKIWQQQNHCRVAISRRVAVQRTSKIIGQTSKWRLSISRCSRGEPHRHYVQCRLSTRSIDVSIFHECQFSFNRVAVSCGSNDHWLLYRNPAEHGYSIVR